MGDTLTLPLRRPTIRCGMLPVRRHVLSGPYCWILRDPTHSTSRRPFRNVWNSIYQNDFVRGNGAAGNLFRQDPPPISRARHTAIMTLPRSKRICAPSGFLDANRKSGAKERRAEPPSPRRRLLPRYPAAEQNGRRAVRPRWKAFTTSATEAIANDDGVGAVSGKVQAHVVLQASIDKLS